jgi:hypothetical protein
VFILTVAAEDPEVIKMSQDYCRYGKARKHFCGWKICPLSVGGSREYEWECLIGRRDQSTSKCSVTWAVCVGLTAVYRKGTSVLSNVANGPL